MVRRLKTVAAALAGLVIAAGPVAAQQIENELRASQPPASSETEGAANPATHAPEGAADIAPRLKPSSKRSSLNIKIK